MKFKKLFFFIIAFSFLQNNLLAETPHFLDFKYILNQSDAGKEAQTNLKNKLSKGLKKLKNEEKLIQEEEKKIIKQKKIISAEEYKKKVSELRNRVVTAQKERDSLLQNIGKQRANARNTILNNLNPIIQEYMKEKKIRMVIDKKSLLLADENLDITKIIIEKLNKKLKSIKLN